MKLTRPIASLLIVISIAVGRPADPAQAQTAADPYAPGEVLVKLKQTSDLAGVLSAYKLTLIDQFGARPIYRLKLKQTSVSPPNKATQLKSDPSGRVLEAEPNFTAQTPEGRKKGSWSIGGSAGGYTSQWAPATIGLPAAHLVTQGGGTIVAVLDTGVDRSHPALQSRLLPGYDFVDWDGDPSEVGSRDVNIVYGHGTHVAGLVALAAPEAHILPVRVLDPEGVGNIWVLVEGLQYAANNQADVINLSLSFTRKSNILAEIVAELTCDDDDCGGDDDGQTGVCEGEICPRPGGVVVVAAAGNSGSTTREYPAAEEVAGVLSVGASTASDTLAGFSNRGAWVDISAPGQRIMSSVPGGYGSWSGTSMAAPLAAGTAALVRASDPVLTAAEVEQRIATTAVPISAPLLRLDAAAALGAR